jgi:GNAT superfamily N-acetyltransferase
MEIIEANEEHREYVTFIIKKRWNVTDEEAQHEFNRWLKNDQDSICYVGIKNSQLMATGAFDTVRDEGGLDISPYNTLLWVEPEYRGNGYGIQLSEIRYKWALDHNYKIIYLDTIDAYDYHIKMGWTLNRKLTHNGEDYSIMQKVLNNKLSFVQTRNIYDYSEVLKPLKEDFDYVFYSTMLCWCKIIPSDNAQGDRLWEVWLIKLGAKQVGICGLYTLHGVETTTELWLGWLGIVPELRNLKLGSQVMEHLYMYAKSVGCERIFSYVDKDGKPLNFYNREGFDVIGTVGEYCDKHCLDNIDGGDFEDKQDFVIMKQLN